MCTALHRVEIHEGKSHAIAVRQWTDFPLRCVLRMNFGKDLDAYPVSSGTFLDAAFRIPRIHE